MKLRYVTALTLAFATPAMATNEEAEFVPMVAGNSQDSTPGTRVVQSDGFVLLEHGIWAAGAPVSQVGSDELGRFGPKPVKGRRVTMLPEPARNSFRRSAYLPWVYAAEVRHSLPFGLLDALIWTESKYNPMAISRAGAVGLAQLMPGTAQDLGVLNRYDPIANIDGGARYLRQMLDRFGSIHLALAAYNAGPGVVGRIGRIPANKETPGYVRRVLERWGLI
jgi:hypothetical protein